MLRIYYWLFRDLLLAVFKGPRGMLEIKPGSDSVINHSSPCFYTFRGMSKKPLVVY